MRLLEWADKADWDDIAHCDGTRDERRRTRSRRARARDELAELLTWDLSGMRHHCPYIGHCETVSQMRQRLKDLVDEVFFEVIPCAPVANRWTKMHPAICWWAAAFALYQLIVRAFGRILPNKYCADRSVNLTADDVAGIGDSTTYHRREAARFYKSRTWRQHPLTPLRLTSAATMLQPILSYMGTFFTSAKLAGRQSNGISTFLHPKSSPAV